MPLAQHFDLPLAKFLGQSHRPIPTSITIGIKPNIYETLAEADEYFGTQFPHYQIENRDQC
ncbi:MAG: hypothetical protein R3C26_13980 [Calditrichia bacterium]